MGIDQFAYDPPDHDAAGLMPEVVRATAFMFRRGLTK
jgi:hypothetical protein